MANYCSNSIVFYSKDKTGLSRFLRKVYAAFDSIGSGFYNLMVLHGYKNREILSVIDKRDSFTNCDSRLEQNEGTYSFRVDVETAWEPHMAMFYKIIREKYSDAIRFVYMAEECGAEIYVNTDKEGMYFPEHYMIDCCHNGEYLKEYFDTYQEAIGWVKSEYTGIDVSEYNSLKEVEAKVETVSDFDMGDFFNFHRFEPEYAYGEERGVA
ncbi:MAG: hypothetical protein IJ242_01595 [Clostridia bacterium]|nr:hypothetical protein [Clostridia bacterium]